MTNAKLLVNLIVDNSSSMTVDKNEVNQKHLNEFIDKISRHFNDEAFELSITTYDGFDVKTTTDFQQIKNSVLLEKNKFPLLGKAFIASLKSIESRVAEFEQMKTHYYKPWIVMLSDGMSYDDLNEGLMRYKKMNGNYRPVIFPFLLSASIFDDNVKTFEAYKEFVTIRDLKYDKMYNWLYNLIKDRLDTEPSKGMRLNKNDMLEWIKQ